MKKELVVLAAIASIILVSATTFAQAYPEGMVSYWKLDEGSGTAAFDYVGTNDGIIYGATWTDGICGNALNFDGTGDYIRISDSPDWDFGDKDFSVELWVKISSLTETQPFWSLAWVSYDTPGMLLRYLPADHYTGHQGLALYNDDRVGPPPSLFVFSEGSVSGWNVDTWHHITFVKSGNNRMLFKDGVQVATYESDDVIPDNYPDMFIGRWSWDWGTSNQYLDGAADEVKIYNSALTADEIKEHYEAGLRCLLVPATIDIDPDTLNLKNNGKWITAYIELPEGYSVPDINVSTILLNGTIYAELKPAEIGDYDEDGIPDRMVKFNRSAIQNILEVGDEVEITITGELYDGTPFEGSDTIRVIDEGKYI